MIRSEEQLKNLKLQSNLCVTTPLWTPKYLDRCWQVVVVQKRVYVKNAKSGTPKQRSLQSGGHQPRFDYTSAIFLLQLCFCDHFLQIFLWKKVKEEKRDHQDGEDRGLQGDDRSLRWHRQTRQRGSSHRRSTQLPEGESFPERICLCPSAARHWKTVSIILTSEDRLYCCEVVRFVLC